MADEPVEASLRLSALLDTLLVEDMEIQSHLTLACTISAHLLMCISDDPDEEFLHVIGSLSEGPILWSSCTKVDLDMLIVMNGMTAFQYHITATASDSKPSWQFLMETCTKDPGYVRLKLLKEGTDTRSIREYLFVKDSSNTILTNYITKRVADNWIKVLQENFRNLLNLVNLTGPAVSPHLNIYGFEKLDVVLAVKCPDWPDAAIEWVERSRVNGWPSQAFVSQQVQTGCYVVPVGCKLCNESFLDWRLSFTRIEQVLIHTFNPTQYKCYTLLKHLKASFIDSKGDKITSYIIKTTMFWTIEETPSDLWQPHYLLKAVHTTLNKLINFIQEDFCPNYFIRNCNLLVLRYNGEEKCDLLKRCLDIKRNLLEKMYETSPFQPHETRKFSAVFTIYQGFLKSAMESLATECFVEKMALTLAEQQTNQSCVQYCKRVLKKITEDAVLQANMKVDSFFHIQNVLQDHIKKFLWSYCYLRSKTNKSTYVCQRALRHDSREVKHLSSTVILCHLDAAAENYAGCNEKLKSVISAQRKQTYVRMSIPNQTTNECLLRLICDTTDHIVSFTEMPVIWDIIFKRSEMNLLPTPLQLEIYSNPKKEEAGGLGFGMHDTVVVDPLVYACFLRFWCSMKLDRNIEKLMARDDLKWACSLPHITNKSVAYNLLGYCHCQLEEYNLACQAFCRALKESPRNKASLFHIATMITDRLWSEWSETNPE